MAEDELAELLRNEAIRALFKEAGPLVVREFIPRLQRLVREGNLTRAIGDRLVALLRPRKDDVIVTLGQYPGFLSLGKDDLGPVLAEIGNGILIVRQSSLPYLVLFKSSVAHQQLVSLLAILKERVFWGSYSFSPRSILARQEIRSQFTRDFQELYDSKLQQLQDRVEARLAEFIALQFKIEEYPTRAGYTLREFVIGAQDVLRIFLEGLRRLSQIDDEPKKAIGRSLAAFLNVAGMLYHFLAIYAPQEVYHADELTYEVMKAFKEYGETPAKSG